MPDDTHFQLWKVDDGSVVTAPTIPDPSEPTDPKPPLPPGPDQTQRTIAKGVVAFGTVA